MNWIKKTRNALTVAFVTGAGALYAQGATPAEDAEALVTTASGVFTLVAGLCLTMIGFYLIVRVVKGIRK